jgi:hypothetical protein
MAMLKYLLVIFAAGSWYASAFLTYLMPDFAFWLLWIGLACCFLMFFFSLSALFRRRWKAVAVFAVAWVAVTPYYLGVTKPFGRLLRQGFRVHLVLAQEYLSGCQLTEFVEKGVKQTVGLCETWIAVYQTAAYLVFYDTTGQIALPVSQKTPEWNDAMYDYSPKKVLSVCPKSS